MSELHIVRSYGVAVKVTSYYGKLEALLNDVGNTLKPKVRCIINIRSQGAGIPDGGLFTPDQVFEDTSARIRDGPLPARGAVEVKGTGDDVHDIAHSEQVAKYLGRYADCALRAHLGLGTFQHAGIGLDRLLHATSRSSDSAVTVASPT